MHSTPRKITDTRTGRGRTVNQRRARSSGSRAAKPERGKEGGCVPQLSNLIDLHDVNSVLEEIRITARLAIPDFDCGPFNRAADDVIRLFHGKYPGYQHCNVAYHDLSHTLAVTLTVVRLIHGAVVSGSFSPDQKELNIGIIGGLMHDTGYIQRRDDTAGTGAKYTLTHISRSIDFVQSYYRQDPVFGKELDSFRDILMCTGVYTKIEDIHFPSKNTEVLGKIIGTGDLLGQMSDRLYLERLLDLYHEFVEGGITAFTSQLDLLDKTRAFYIETRKRFAEDFSGVYGFSRHHFRTRWGIDQDLYMQAIEENLTYLDFVITHHRNDYQHYLRRNVPNQSVFLAMTP